MGEWDIKFREQQLAAYERAKQQMRELVEQKQLRAAAAEAEAKLRATEVKDAKPSSSQSTESGGPKAKLARVAGAVIWPNGIPPNTPPQAIYKKVADYVKKKYGVEISKNQMLRALGLK